MVISRRRRQLLLGLFVLLAWAAYFAICSAPTGGAFIYVDF